MGMFRLYRIGGGAMKRIPYYLDHEISGDLEKEYGLHMRLREIMKKRLKLPG